MKVYSFNMIQHVAENLGDVMKDKKKKVELEERLRMGLAHEWGIDPSTFTVDVMYNRTADSFDLQVKRQ